MRLHKLQYFYFSGVSGNNTLQNLIECIHLIDKIL